MSSGLDVVMAAGELGGGGVGGRVPATGQLERGPGEVSQKAVMTAPYCRGSHCQLSPAGFSSPLQKAVSAPRGSEIQIANALE